MMSDTVLIKRTLERKAGEFEANKEMFRDRITDGIRIAREKLEKAENELLKKLEIFFGSNVYSECISELNSGNTASLKEAASIASIPAPARFGPDGEDFGRLYREIDRIIDTTSTQSATPPPPKNLTVQGVGKDGFHNGASLSWSAAKPEQRNVDRIKYKIQMMNEHKMAREYDSSGTSCVFQNLKPGTLYAFSVRCIWDDVAGPWCDVVEFTTSPIPVPTSIECVKAEYSEAIITWKSAPIELTWEVEIHSAESPDTTRRIYEETVPSCTIKSLECDTEYIIRIRAKTGDDKRGNWSNETKFRTKKWTCSWKHCPPSVDDCRKYTVIGSDGKIDNIATRSYASSGNFSGYSLVIGNNPIPLDTTVSWEVILRTVSESCYAGIAPADIDQNDQYIDRRATYINDGDFYVKSPYLYCGGLSGLYRTLKYSINLSERLREDYCFHDPSRVTYIRVTVDTRKGEISFEAIGVNMGTVRQIPLDKPLVPFAALSGNKASVELVI